MLLSKKRRLGRKIEEMTVGEKLKLTEKVEDKDLLLYLGLTNDGNPLYIQHDYASQTEFGKPIVPAIMLNGIVTSAISKYFPGPGSHVQEQHLRFPKPVYHYETIELLFEVKEIDVIQNLVTITVVAENEDSEIVIEGKLVASAPRTLEQSIEE
ncbi:MaoC/PaaZ C-terminal domain-containing protein [Chungangia koreensis]|uniref:MaoC/PaaZ C-terminal domain-containing protein n=1 Tax=Chungangia koreensis TaxID=752657 RepID=A0ABV8X448_9LACT